MMKFQYIGAFILLMLLSCNDSEPEIDGPAGLAEYYIDNNTDIDLNIIFIKSSELNFEIDSSSVSKNTSVKIFEDGAIGLNPKPTNSFSKISFFDASKTNQEDAILVISEIIDHDWLIIEQDLTNDGYGITKYELSITKDNFN